MVPYLVVLVACTQTKCYIIPTHKYKVFVSVLCAVCLMYMRGILWYVYDVYGEIVVTTGK